MKVTVLMPAYNSQTYLCEAIESILCQTFSDFEFLIVNDASTDNTGEILKRYAKKDSRIRVIGNRKEKGIVGALNTGLEEARGEYIARMDADDISLPERLQKQVAFMDRHPEIGASGTWMKTLGSHNSRLWFPFPADHERIRIALLFYTPLAHPTAIIRRSLINQHGLRYEEAFKYAEDFDLWERASRLFPLANIREVLLLYRVHADSVSKTRADEQTALTRKVKARQIARLGITATNEEADIHDGVFFGPFTGNDFTAAARAWLSKLLYMNRRKCVYDIQLFEGELRRIYSNIRKNGQPARSSLRKLLISPLGSFSLRGLPSSLRKSD